MDGDEPAPGAARFEEVFRSHYGPVVAFFARRTTERGEAEDLAAATFVAAWRHVDELPADGRARSWLLGFAYGVLANHRRGARRKDRLLARLVELRGRDLEASPATPAEAALAAFGRLAKNEQEVLRLALWDDLPAAEAAAALGCSIGAYYVRLHRARRALKAAYARLAGVVASPPCGLTAEGGGEA